VEVLRTPDERFQNLPGFDFEPHYVEVGGVRIAYLDEGPREGAPILLLHGEPTWSFLYRKMLPVLAGAGQRAIAVDLPGFGRSDKPAEPHAYTYAAFVGWVRGLVEQLDLRGATLFGQDWGGLIGLRVVTEIPDRFVRIIAANTGLPDGLHKPSEAWYRFRDFSQNVEELPIGFLVKSGCARGLADDAVAAYEAPFPEERYKVAARRFPLLIPVTEDDPGAIANREAWKALADWRKPFHCAFSDGDPITRGADRPFLKVVPGAQSVEHVTIAGAGHFLQEDAGVELAEHVVRFCQA
jgi:haloalkane dehalogenase